MLEYDASMSVCPYCAYPKTGVPSEPYYLSEGTLLDGKYTIGKVLGNGSFSITYLAWDNESQQKIVIKEYFPKTLASRISGQNEINAYDGEKSKQFEKGLMAFVEEASNLKKLTQSLDGIVKTLDVFVENSTAYSITEYIDGISLDRVLSKSRLPWEDVIQIMTPLLQSLSVLQNNSIVCYNISPDNIIMTRDKKVKLLGLGASKFATGGATMDFSLVTKAGFSPIEMYRDALAADNSIDTYSLAAVIYYAVTGVIPQGAVERVSDDKLVSPLELGIHVPKNVNTAIMNALNVSPKYRTKDCSAFFEELNSIGEVQRIFEIKQKEETGSMSKKTKLIIASVAVLVAAVIAAIVFATVHVDSSSANKNDDTLPNFVDMEKDEAEKKLKELNIEYQFCDPQELATVEKGKEIVAAQNVEAGTPIKEVKKIELKIAIPLVERGKMPYLSALTKDDAVNALKKAGFKNYSFDTRTTNTYKEGAVCGQSIKGGKTVALETEIVVYIAKAEVTAPLATQYTKKYTPKTKKPNTTKKSKPSKSKTTTTENHRVDVEA